MEETDIIQHTESSSRIMTAFELWWRELEQILHRDLERAIVCLNHISRILEDSGFVIIDMSQVDETKTFETILAEAIAFGFEHIANSACHLMYSSTDLRFKNACIRMMAVFKLCCGSTSDTFYEVFPYDELVQFLAEQDTNNDELFHSRVAFLIGELISDGEFDIAFDPSRYQRLFKRMKEIKEDLSNRRYEIMETMEIIRSRCQYTRDPNILIPLPEIPQTELSYWSQDEAEITGSILYNITVLNSYIRFVASLAEVAEAVSAAVNEGLMKECIELITLPCFAIQTYALMCIGCYLINRKLAIEFVELEGYVAIIKMTDLFRNSHEDMTTLGTHVTFIFVSLSKHQIAMDLLVKANNANYIVEFVISFLATDKYQHWETNINILEWCSESMAHPLILRELQKRSILSIFSKALQDGLLAKFNHQMEYAVSLNYIRLTTEAILKYVIFNLFWGYQYSKCLYTESDEWKATSKLPTLMRKNYIGSAGCIDVVEGLISSPTMNKINDTEAQLLEAFVLKSLIRLGHLPKGLTVDLFGGESYKPPTNLDRSFTINSTISHEDLETQSVASMMVPPKILPEWTIAMDCIRSGIIPCLIITALQDMKDSSTVCMALYCLQLLCLDASIITEILQFDLVSGSGPHLAFVQLLKGNEEFSIFQTIQNKKGLDILLFIVSSQERR
jgi:hypothetical protein